MVKRSWITHRIPAGVVGAMTMALVFSQSVTAHEALKDVSKEIREFGNGISMIDVHLVRPDVSFRSGLDEIDVVRMGCHYSVKNPKDVASLIEVLAKAEVEQTPPSDDGFDARMVFRFYEGTVRARTLVLGPDYTNAHAKGIYYKMHDAKRTAVPVEAKNGIERNVRFWKSQHESLAVKPCHH